MSKEDIEKHMSELPQEEYLRIIASTAQARFKAMKQKSSRATYYNQLSVTAGKFLRLIRG